MKLQFTNQKKSKPNKVICGDKIKLQELVYSIQLMLTKKRDQETGYLSGRNKRLMYFKWSQIIQLGNLAFSFDLGFTWNVGDKREKVGHEIDHYLLDLTLLRVINTVRFGWVSSVEFSPAADCFNIVINCNQIFDIIVVSALNCHVWQSDGFIYDRSSHHFCISGPGGNLTGDRLRTRFGSR